MRRGWIPLFFSLWTGIAGTGALSAQGGADDASLTPDYIDVEAYEITAEIEPPRSFLSGEARIDFTVLEETLAVSFAFNRQLTMIDVTDDSGERYSLRADDFSRDHIRVQGDTPFRRGEKRSLLFRFEGILEKEQYAFLDVPSTQRAVIDPEGAVLLSEGNWFPSHKLATDAARTTVRITVPLGFTVVAPGSLAPVETVGISEVFTWKSEQPLTQLPLIVARYYRQVYDEGEVPLTFFVTEDFEGDLESLAEAVSELLDFFGKEYGAVPIDQLSFAQVRNIELGSTGARGLILLEPQVLEAYTIPWFDLAERVAEQWWGYSLRLGRPIDAWLKDGFSTYAAIRFYEEKRPEDFTNQLARLAVDALKYQDTAPIISGINLEVGSPKYESIISSKGAWVLYMLGQLIGRDTLHSAMQSFYMEHADGTATIPDFVAAVHETVDENYNWFFLQWIESVGVPEFTVDYTIFKLKEGGYKIRGQVKQNLDLFKMPMDVLIETKGAPEEKKLQVDGKSTAFSFDTETLPVQVEIDPKGKVLMDSDRMRVAVHIALGDEYKEKGEYVSAIEEYENAVELNARNSLAHFRLGETFFEQHSYSNAANSMRDSLNGDLKPEWVETWAHIYLGKVFDILGQRQRARAEYQKAINSKVDYNGAQAEAQKYLDEPYTKPSNVLG